MNIMPRPCRVEFFDSIREEPNSTSTTGNEKEQDVFMIRPFATKILRLVHPSLEFSDSPCPPVSADLATSMFKSGEHTHLLKPPQRDCANWSLFAMATGQVEVKLKVKQQDEVPGKKVSFVFSRLLHPHCHQDGGDSTAD